MNQKKQQEDTARFIGSLYIEICGFERTSCIVTVVGCHFMNEWALKSLMSLQVWCSYRHIPPEDCYTFFERDGWDSLVLYERMADEAIDVSP